jgi:hypothetical protein
MAKQAGSKKGARSGRNKSKGVYTRQRVRTTKRKHAKAIKRAKNLEQVKAHPEIGSPSQLRERGFKAWTIDFDSLAEMLAEQLAKNGAVITGKPTIEIIKKAMPIVNPVTIRDANWTLH